MIASDTGSKRYDLLSLGLMLLLVFLVLATFRDYGYSWDETWQNRWYGQAVIRFITSFGTDISATNTNNFYLYGGTFDVFAELLAAVSPLEPRNARHLANALAGFAGISGCWALARRLGGAAAAFWAVLFLACCAPWYGHLFINAKDIPFAAGYIWSLFLLLRAIDEFPSPALRTQILLGLVIGLTLGVRIGGVLILLYLGLSVLLYLGYEVVWRQGGKARLYSHGVKLLPALLTIGGIAWAVMLVCWPAALLHPLAIPLEAFRAATNFQFVSTLLWSGQEVWTNDLPWNYLPVIFAVQLPEVLVLLFALALVWGLCLLSRWGRDEYSVGDRPGIALLLLAILFPVVWAIAMRSTIYDNGRHFLFVLPPLICLAALGWTRLLAWSATYRRGTDTVLQMVMVSSLLVSVGSMATIHPYEYAYLNAFAGGMPKGASRFDSEYWITSYREASRALESHAREVAKTAGTPFSSMPFSVAVFGPPEILAEELPGNFKLTAYQPDIRTDYLVTTTRWNADQLWPDWQTIAEVGRRGMRFAVVKAAPQLVQLVPPLAPKN